MIKTIQTAKKTIYIGGIVGFGRFCRS